MSIRGGLTISLGIIAVAVLVFLLSTRSSDGVPLRPADELAGLPDDKLEGAVLMELGRSVYRDGTDPEAWRRLSQRGRHLWAVASLQNIEGSQGVGPWLKSFRDGATGPRPEEIREGLSDMGLDAARLALEEAIAKGPDVKPAQSKALHIRIVKELAAARQARTQWIRDHLKDIASY